MLKMNESNKKLISDTYGCGETYGRIDVISTTLETEGRETMLYNKRSKRAHEEIEYIFRTLLPENGLMVREEQILLSHQMLDALLYKQIALCDAGVGIGKTYAYLAACVIMRKYAMNRTILCSGKWPVVISTSSVALQKAIIGEYIPFLSKVLLRAGVIQTPLKACVRKGKERYVCDKRLERRLLAIQDKPKNTRQKEALLSLRTHFDLDDVHGLSGFDRRQVNVPRSCERDCRKFSGCRYQRYLQRAKDPDVFIQICNHNYLLADSSHRIKAYQPLLNDYQALVIDEAHKLPEAAQQMFGKSLSMDDIIEISSLLEGEHYRVDAVKIREAFRNLSDCIQRECSGEGGGYDTFPQTTDSMLALKMTIQQLRKTQCRTEGVVPRWITNRLGEAGEVLGFFFLHTKAHILYLQQDKNGYPTFCAVSRETPKRLGLHLWKRDIPSILTSGTLMAGNGFKRTRQEMGLGDMQCVREYVAKSPFLYRENCLLYLPRTLKRMKKGSPKEVKMIAGHIKDLICVTHGHTLVLFTSYTLMGNVYQELRDKIPFPLLEVWRHSQEEISHFKQQRNAVLFAAGSCWEGVDFPGDMVSSLIIVKLPFAVPDPVSESEREPYGSLNEYIRDVIVPDMQKRLRQGFGRAIRTEQDTCVVSVLDYRAVSGGAYYEDVLRALPVCKMADSIGAVERFIRERKNVEYYM